MEDAFAGRILVEFLFLCCLLRFVRLSVGASQAICLEAPEDACRRLLRLVGKHDSFVMQHRCLRGSIPLTMLSVA